MNRPRVGVVLSGCGVFDGAEIHETVITLLALDRGGAEILCMAPNIAQMHVINHLNGEVTSETRNVLVEAARITRGAIVDIATVDTATLDGLVLPGGFGAAKNLSDFAVAGASCTVHPEVERVIRAVHAAGKPVAAMCIAPVILAKLFGDHKVSLTIGDDTATAAALQAMGGRHIDCPTNAIVVDEGLRIISTPAYMLAQSIGEAAKGIEKLVSALLKIIKKR